MGLCMKLREDIVFYKYDENSFHMHDESNNKHFSIGKEQKEWLELFNGSRSLEEITRLIPGQYIEQFLSYVYKYNLLENDEIAQRTRINIFKIKIKLANINNRLEKIKKQCFIYSYLLKRTSVIFLICNMYFLYKNFGNILLDLRVNFFSPSMWGTLLIGYLLTIITGIFHELSHALVAKANNVAIPQIGIMLFYFNPAFYVDLSGIRILSNKKDKIDVLAAGLKMNNFLLFVGLVVLNYSKNILIRQSLSFYIVFNIIVVLINIIPFIEFDGYYICSEFFNDKNLKLTATLHVKRLFKREFNKVQIHYIFYFVYSLIFSSAFVVLGVTSIMQIINRLWNIPQIAIIGLLFASVILNIKYQIKKGAN